MFVDVWQLGRVHVEEEKCVGTDGCGVYECGTEGWDHLRMLRVGKVYNERQIR